MRIRSFIAINLPREIKEKLAQTIIELKKVNAQVPIKWVNPGIIHLTLHFLGDLDERELLEVQNILSDLVVKNNTLELEIGDWGGFPNLQNPRIIFIDCREIGGKTLVDLQNEIGKRLKKIGLPTDNRPWQTHITLGRLRTPSPLQITNLNELQIKNLLFKVKSIDLMKSELTPTGPIYTILKSYPLKPSLSLTL